MEPRPSYPATDSPGRHALVCMDPRHVPGRIYCGRILGSAAEVHQWVDSTSDDVRRDLVEHGYRVRSLDPPPAEDDGPILAGSPFTAEELAEAGRRSDEIVLSDPAEMSG